MSFCAITNEFRHINKTPWPNLPVTFDLVPGGYDDTGQYPAGRVEAETNASGKLSESLWVGKEGSSYRVTVKGSPTYQINIPPNISAASLAYLRNRSAPAGTLSEWQAAVPDPVFRAALEGIGITSLAELRAATSINLNNVDLTGANWEGIRYATQINTLRLKNTYVVGVLSDLKGISSSYMLIYLDNGKIAGDLTDLDDLTQLVYFSAVDVPTIFASQLSFTTQPGLSTIWLYGCHFDQGEVDKILAGLVSSLSLPGRVTCDVHLGNNTAPDAQGLADVDTLVSAGWTVTHDS